MSEKLRTMLNEQARSVEFRPPDLEGIRQAGDRRIRGRRGVAALAALAVGAVVWASVTVVGGPGDRSRFADPGSPGPADSVSWALGSKIHVGADVIDVGHEVRAYVRTSVGFVFVDPADDVYSVTTDGVTRIGHMEATVPDNLDQQRLASDPAGSLVGWVGEEPSGSLVLQAYDQATGELRSYEASGAGQADDALFFAIDDRTGYWRTPSGVYAVDLDTGSQQQLLAITGVPGYDFEIYSAENGMLAFSPDSDRTILAGRSVEDAEELVRFGEKGVEGLSDPIRLSPTGAWLSVGIGRGEPAGGAGPVEFRFTGEVYDTSTGDPVGVDLPGDLHASPGVWLGDSTLQVLALAGDLFIYEDAVDFPTTTLGASLYVCSLPDASCELAADLGSYELVPNVPSELFVLPDGRYWWYDGV